MSTINITRQDNDQFTITISKLTADEMDRLRILLQLLPTLTDTSANMDVSKIGLGAIITMVSDSERK